MMTPKQYLINFTSLVRWDVQKLIAVAEAGELEQLSHRSTAYATATRSVVFPVPTPTSGVLPESAGSGLAPMSTSVHESSSTTGSPYPRLLGSPFLEQHTPKAAKCAVPMAMTLIAAIEFIGSLLNTSDIWDARDKFDRAITKFFDYAGFPLDNTEKDVLRQSFRNGMAHNFMMQGVDVAIDYQSRFKSEKRLLFTEGKQTVLNVNKLQEIVFGVFDKLPMDASIYFTVIVSAQEYEKGKKAKTTADYIAAFKAYDATRS